jgi:ketosteroid isomerase-like protein
MPLAEPAVGARRVTRAVAARLAALLAVGVGLTLAVVAPAVARESKNAAQAIVDNERAFQQAVIDLGERDGFLAFLAESAVLFRPRPVPGRALYLGKPDPGTQLRWRPDLAHVSGGGDFGWSSGPWMLGTGWATGRPGATGHYLTVWRREAAGQWRVVLDGAAPYPIEENEKSTHLAVTPRLREPGGGRGKRADCAAEFFALWRKDGRAEALEEFVAKDVRLAQAGRPPLDGAKAARRGDLLRDAVLAAGRVTRSVSSESNDVVVTYGEYELAAQPDVPRRRFVYAQAWDVGRKCELALELITPVG